MRGAALDHIEFVGCDSFENPPRDGHSLALSRPLALSKWVVSGMHLEHVSRLVSSHLMNRI